MAATAIATKFEDPTVLISYFDLEDDYVEVIRVVDTNWTDLDAFELDFPGSRFGNLAMAAIARAYKMAGNAEKFADAIKRLQASLQKQREQGSNHLALFISEAYSAMLIGEEELALLKLEELSELGSGIPDFSRLNSVFKPLEADTRYQAVIDKLDSYVARERQKLGLPQIEDPTLL